MNGNDVRVAILGGTGFAGRKTREILETAGITVGVFSRTTGCDLLDLHEAWAKLDAFRPNYIVNCAALVGSVNYVTDFAADVVDVNMRIIKYLKDCSRCEKWSSSTQLLTALTTE